MRPPVLATERLLLRPWEERDKAPFAAANADPEVMRHFPGRLDRAGSDALVARIEARWAEDGFCLGVAERKADGAFLGMVGLARLRMPDVPRIDGAVEVAWRLARAHWGQGYATEAARGWLGWGFGTGEFDEIVAIAVPGNHASLAVMQRLGMAEDRGGRFEHPAVPEGSPLRPHLLFRIGRTQWLRENGAG